MFLGLSNMIGLVKSGQFTGLALNADSRLPLFPDIPTLADVFAEGVLVHESAFLQSNAVVVQGRAGVLLIDPGVHGSEMAAIADNSPLADDLMIELEEQHLIRNALKLLEERCQQILSMIYLCDPAASYAEVAAAIGVGDRILARVVDEHGEKVVLER